MMARKSLMKRTGKNRSRRPIIYIFCEGRETEKLYFNRYKFRDGGLEVRAISTQHKDAPGIVAETHTAMIRDGDYSPEDKDQVWCLFDCDDNSNEQLKRAKEMAEKHNYHIAFSNPSFELWFLLHFKDQQGVISNHALIRELNRIPAFGNYSKSADYYGILKEHRDTAVKRAKKLLQRHGEADTAFKLKTVRNADNIIVLDDGRVVEQGQHEALLQNGGLYSRLYSVQQQSMDWGTRR